MKLGRRLALAVLLTLAWTATSWSAHAATSRIRGTIAGFDADKITVAKRDGGIEPLAIDADTRFLEVVPVGIDAIKPGSYIGVAGLPQPDGKIRALGVMVFPEAARGTAEGHFPFDLQPESTMTNATVAEVAQVQGGREVVVTYQGGSQTIDIADPEKIASFTLADRSVLKDGAKATVIVEETDSLPKARTVLVGKDGFTPPN